MFAPCNEVVGSTLQGANTRFYYSVTRHAAKGELYVKLVNASPLPQRVNLAISGTSLIEPTGTIVTLHAATREATNTIDEPQRIVPVETKLTGAGPRFEHEVPPFSIQVLAIRTR